MVKQARFFPFSAIEVKTNNEISAPPPTFTLLYPRATMPRPHTRLFASKSRVVFQCTTSTAQPPPPPLPLSNPKSPIIGHLQRHRSPTTHPHMQPAQPAPFQHIPLADPLRGLETRAAKACRPPLRHRSFDPVDALITKLSRWEVGVAVQRCAWRCMKRVVVCRWMCKE